ncbi:hypothetical protein TcG_09612 [Trypanosoma cruzi]|nr:hypothetical protein TcG_09612 [Trypanosoma cruzi]
MVTAERVVYFAIWRVCGDPCGWCDGACFTCGERRALLHGGAHVVCGGFSCCWFVNVFSFAFAETPQRAVSADSRALRGGAPHDFWRDEAASVNLRCLFSGLRDYPLLECIVGGHPRVCFC